MGLLETIKQKAAAAHKRIVLAEGEEPRILRAAQRIVKEGIAELTLIGSRTAMQRACPDADLTGIRVIQPEEADLSKYVSLLLECRKAKGMTEEEAKRLVKNPLYLGVLLVKSGECDGMVAGSIHSTGDVLRPALQIIKTAPGIGIVSSCFIMILPEGSPYGDDGVMVFGDCAVNPDPDADALAAIAIASADSAKKIAGLEPRVAMLSFSTKGSAKHDAVTKVAAAVGRVAELAPGLCVDGELQADAALVESVGALKAPGSCVAGRANVLIFPDLGSGNIGYKLVQRLAGAEAIGPICQGFNRPVNDLSRGCSSDDVVNVVAMTALQAL
ncbi:MAG: phosphate acetyltransferase [Clostridiales bacterium]|jgi:phosphate acetyltransferase|nr:phosphate acetyltransferase [Clostridiales bacterium]